jgi:phospholipid-translocating ATPase
MNMKTFMIWTWVSIYQAAAIMFTALFFFDNSFTNIVTITFSSLIVIEMLNILSEVHTIKYQMVISICLTIVVYFFTIITFRNIIQTSYIDMAFVVKVSITCLICWAPITLFNAFMARFDPN